MEILGGNMTGSSSLLTYIHFSFVSCQLKKKYTMNTPWKETAGDMLESKLKEISQFSITIWKEHNNRILFQTKNYVMMEPNRIWFLNANKKIETPQCQIRILRLLRKRKFIDEVYGRSCPLSGQLVHASFAMNQWLMKSQVYSQMAYHNFKQVYKQDL